MMKSEVDEEEPGQSETETEEVVQKQEITDLGNEEDAMAFDLSEDYEEIFGANAEFDSWDEFSSTLEDFSKKTGFYYKPRSACTVEYLNEKRVNAPIPDRFVYAKVKMICVHYGDPPKTENGHTPRKGFNYVGKGCESYLQVSFNKGALKVGKCNLIHKNHPPRSEDDETPLRQFRNFTFSEDLDILIAREVLRNNPFELANGEKRWIQAVEILKGEDTRLINLTPRLIKKRIRFLIDKFVAVSHGRMPAAEDEMGNILYELNRTKRDRLDNPPGRGRKRKNPQSVRFSPLATDNGDFDYDESGAEEDHITGTRGRKRRRSQSPPHKHNNSSHELSAFIAYLRRKDEEDRKLRMQELELTREELTFRRREMDFQKQRFEFEKFERKAHLDLLKAQLAVLERNQISLKQEVVTKEREQPVEYTIVLDNNHQTVVS